MSEKKPVETADLFRLKIVQSAALSPDGGQVVYAVAEVNEETEKESVSLWLVDVETAVSRWRHPVAVGLYGLAAGLLLGFLGSLRKK